MARKNYVKHGGHTTHKREFNSWRAMINRCHNKNYWCYQRYGGRGIEVHDRWKRPAGTGFPNFLKDMGKKPSPEHSLDRIDNDGNYEPSNCRWVDKLTQHNNTSRSVFETIDGVTKTRSEWCREYEVPIHQIYNRVGNGRSFEFALKTPPSVVGAHIVIKQP